MQCYFKTLQCILLTTLRAREGEGYSLLWPIRGHGAEQGMFFGLSALVYTVQGREARNHTLSSGTSRIGHIREYPPPPGLATGSIAYIYHGSRQVGGGGEREN